MSMINKARLAALKSSFSRHSSDYARLVSLSSPFAGLWLTTLPTDSAFTLSDPHFSSSSRLRLGLPPVDDLRHCFCGTSLTQHPLHFLNCNQLRSSFISRHDRLLQLFAPVSRLVGITVQIESHLDNQDSSRSDALFFFPSSSAHTDVSVIHPPAPSYYKQGHTPLHAASTCEKRKDLLYADRARQQGARFFPLALESFGAFGKRLQAFLLVLDEEANCAVLLVFVAIR